MTEPEGRVTLWGIEVFVAAAEEGSISAAARRLGVSPSAVSQQLSGLESALGAVLLDRSGRPMQVTPAGAMFRRHAQTILNAASEARAELAMADLAGMTTLRLGVIEDQHRPAAATRLDRAHHARRPGPDDDDIEGLHQSTQIVAAAPSRMMVWQPKGSLVAVQVPVAGVGAAAASKSPTQRLPTRARWPPLAGQAAASACSSALRGANSVDWLTGGAGGGGGEPMGAQATVSSRVSIGSIRILCF